MIFKILTYQDKKKLEMVKQRSFSQIQSTKIEIHLVALCSH